MISDNIDVPLIKLGRIYNVEDNIIPPLKVLKEMFVKEMVQENGIAEGASYDFNRCYCSLVAKRRVFDRIEEDFMDMKNSLERR